MFDFPTTLATIRSRRADLEREADRLQLLRLARAARPTSGGCAHAAPGPRAPTGAGTIPEPCAVAVHPSAMALRWLRCLWSTAALRAGRA